jgi:hypothetical protein
VVTWLSHLVDALTGSELLKFDLRGQYAQLIVIQQRKQWDLFQCCGITCHGSHLVLTIVPVTVRFLSLRKY